MSFGTVLRCDGLDVRADEFSRRETLSFHHRQLNLFVVDSSVHSLTFYELAVLEEAMAVGAGTFCSLKNAYPIPMQLISHGLAVVNPGADGMFPADRVILLDQVPDVGLHLTSVIFDECRFKRHFNFSSLELSD